MCKFPTFKPFIHFQTHIQLIITMLESTFYRLGSNFLMHDLKKKLYIPIGPSRGKSRLKTGRIPSLIYFLHLSLTISLAKSRIIFQPSMMNSRFSG